MSSKLVMTFLIIFFIGTLFSAIMNGGGGIDSARVTSDLTATATTINVNSTSGFLDSDILIIGEEKILYTNRTATTFTVPTGGRGYDGTSATTHGAGSFAYTQATDVFNQMMGFNIAATGTTVGSVNIAVAAKRFLFTSVPNLVKMDFSFLTGPLFIFRVGLVLLGAAFAVYIAIIVAQALGGVLQSIFVRR